MRDAFGKRLPVRLAACLLAISTLAISSSDLFALDTGAGTGGQPCSQAYQSDGQSLPDQMRASDCQPQSADSNAENLTPEQRYEIQKELQRNGGQLTPEAMEALRQNPEFKDVNIDEVLRGKEMQDGKDPGQNGNGYRDHTGEDTSYEGAQNGQYGRGRGYDAYGGSRYGRGGYVGRPYERNGYGNGYDYNENGYGVNDYSGNDYNENGEDNYDANDYGVKKYGDNNYGNNYGGPGYGRQGINGMSGYPGSDYKRGGPGGSNHGPGNYTGEHFGAGAPQGGRYGGRGYEGRQGNEPGVYGPGPDRGRYDYAAPAGPYGRGYGGTGSMPAENYDEWMESRRRAAGRPSGENGALFDRYIKDNPLDVSTSLKPFGYDLFTGVFLNPPRDLPVAFDYAIGPGDEINVFIWGRISARYTLTVNRDGTVLFPNVGAINVSGMTFEEMKNLLTKEAKKTVGAEVSIAMGRLRSIQVFVLGEVNSPGAYTLSAMSTLTNALLAAGGPTKIGSLRNVELKRDNSVAANMDFYDLLLNGDRSKDVRLQNGDLVFVPTIGPIVGVAGNVKRPAVYELKGTADLSTVLGLAGGIIPTAYTQQIQVERVEKNEKRIVVDINAKTPGAAASFKLQDGDLVKVAAVVDKDVNAVYLHGNVKRPGKYELKEGMKLSDVIKDDSALEKESYLGYGLIKRLVPPTYGVELIPFSLAAIFSDPSSPDNLALKPLDTIYVFSKWFFKDRPTVTIRGYVRKGGRFNLEENMTVKDLVLLAGSLKKDASRSEFELYRTDPDTRKVTLEKLNLEKAMEGDKDNNLKLKDQDRVVIHSISETSPRRSVTVTGEVNRPGRYEYAGNMTVRDLVFAAGGLRESAYTEDAELALSVIKEGQSFAITYEKIDLGKAMAGDPAANLRLHPYDTLFIKKIPEWREENYVELKGEVVFPGRYIVRKGDRLSSLIERAGGFTPKAYLKGAVFTRESVRILQQKNIDEAVSRLEKTVLSTAASTIQSSLTPEDAKQQATALEQKKELLIKMRAARAKGRISISLEDAMKKKGSSLDVRLENKDKLEIPERPGEVQVMGSVYNQTAFVYDPAASISSYIKKAGGFTEDANEDEIYILKEDGTALSGKYDGSWGPRWDSANHRWVSGGFMNSNLDPGDTIVFPEKVEKIAWLREIKDFTQILYQIAVTAGVAIRVL